MLERILQYKREELEHLKRKVRLADVRKKAEDQEPARDFLGALSPAHQIKVIAELKKASPSAGVIVERYDPVGIALRYEENGAAAISVLTDGHFFGGRLSHVGQLREKVTLPLLRKDFTFDEYQIYEARGAGADAVLLIVRILSDSQLTDYRALAADLEMAALVEVHDPKELGRAVASGAKMIGINNRDLDSGTVDLGVSEKLADQPHGEATLVVESGIASRREIERLEKCGLHAFLVGESLLRERDPGAKLRELIGWSS